MFHFVHALLFLNTKDKIYYLVIKVNFDKKKCRIVSGDGAGVTDFFFLLEVYNRFISCKTCTCAIYYLSNNTCMCKNVG